MNPPPVPNRPQRWLWILAAANILIMAVMQTVGQALKPGGIVFFEFAGTIVEAQVMLSLWRENGVMPQLLFLIGFDYLFLVTYSAFIWLACRELSHSFSGSTAKSLVVISLLQPVAGLLDAVENMALYKMALGSTQEILPVLSMVCAVPKFGFVLVGLASVVIAGIAKRVRK